MCIYTHPYMLYIYASIHITHPKWQQTTSNAPGPVPGHTQCCAALGGAGRDSAYALGFSCSYNIWVCLCIYIHIYIEYTHTHTYMYMYIYIYIYTHRVYNPGPFLGSFRIQPLVSQCVPFRFHWPSGPGHQRGAPEASCHQWISGKICRKRSFPWNMGR